MHSSPCHLVEGSRAEECQVTPKGCPFLQTIWRICRSLCELSSAKLGRSAGPLQSPVPRLPSTCSAAAIAC
eukprot:5489735-Amphidinium_carterae.1